MADIFHCSVVTPERSVLDCDATFVAFPAHDGEGGVLVNRAPLLCKLGIGTLRAETADNQMHLLFIDGGFAQVVENRVTILTEQAKAPDEIDGVAAQQALAEARAMPITDDNTYKTRANAIRRAEIQIKLARSG